MQCPFCESSKSRVVDTRGINNTIRRRRECQTCGKRFTTYERIASPGIKVVKRDGRKEDYDREKLSAGVKLACTKRPVAEADVDNLVELVEEEIHNVGRSQIKSKLIGELVLERLRDLDEVAYVRFASVYFPLKDLASLQEKMMQLLQVTT